MMISKVSTVLVIINNFKVILECETPRSLKD